MSIAIQRSLFEDDYLVRNLGEIAYRPETAISELVANAWDAGAINVKITIPDELTREISVEDDGIGLNESLFTDRWMRLGYQRVQHQGNWAEFPSERKDWKRRAYGRNGQGRHGMLCFGARYHVDTLRDCEQEGRRFTVEPASNESAFVLSESVPVPRISHGCRVWTFVEKNLPSVEKIVDAMSLTFLSDPNFSIFVNEQRVSVESFSTTHEETIELPQGKCVVKFLKIPPGKRLKGRGGVAFWVGNRLVGQPEYQLFGVPLIDGRSTVAREHLIVVQSDDLYDLVKPDCEVLSV